MVSKDEYHDILRSQGFEPTGQKTETGTTWVNNSTGTFRQVPDPEEDQYPDWMIEEMVDVTGTVGN